MDTDVEVLGSFDKFLDHTMFLGFEEGNFVGTCVMGTEKGHELMQTYLSHYDGLTYFNEDGTKYTDTNVVLLTKLLEERGLQRNDKLQTVRDITIYPRTCFSPYDYINGINYITDDSVAIHHFAQLWLPKSVRIKTEVKKALVKIIGGENLKKLRNLKK